MNAAEEILFDELASRLAVLETENDRLAALASRLGLQNYRYGEAARATNRGFARKARGTDNLKKQITYLTDFIDAHQLTADLEAQTSADAFARRMAWKAQQELPESDK